MGYVAAAAFYGYLRRRGGDTVTEEERGWVILAAALGALAGSRLLAAIADLPAFPGEWRRPAYWLHGKTVVGGLLGGWIGVELAKRRAGIRARTGDLFAAPLAAGIAVGRIGCFLAGPGDHTAGNPTSLPWGIAVGDGVRRHPAALYEVAFLLLLLPLLLRVGRTGPSGAAFRLFAGAYLSFRLAVDFVKPDPPPFAGGLSAIQWACVLGIAAVAWGGLRGPARAAIAVEP